MDTSQTLLADFYGMDVVKDVIKEADDVVKLRGNVTKEFVKARRQIYKLNS